MWSTILYQVYQRMDLLIFLKALTMLVPVLLLVQLIVWIRREEAKYSSIPCIKHTFLVGDLLGLLELYWNSSFTISMHTLASQVITGFGKAFTNNKIDLFRIRLGPMRNIVAIFNANSAEALLAHSKNIEKAPEYSFIKSWLGTGLLTNDGPSWRRRRKLLTPAFHFQILENFAPVMRHHMASLVEYIDSGLENGRRVVKDVRPLMVNYTLDVILETAMGIKMNVQKNWFELERSGKVTETEEIRYANSLSSFFEILGRRLFRPWLYLEPVFQLTRLGKESYRNVDTMHRFTNKIIQQRKEEFLAKQKAQSETGEENFGKKRMAFLDLLMTYHLESPDELDLKSLAQEVDTFMFGGHETTSTSLEFSLLLIGSNSEKQKLIHEELDSIFGDDIDREMTGDDFKQMNYLELCIKESLRLYPPAALYGRHVTETFQCGKSTVPAGCTAFIVTPAVHYDPHVYDQPERFIPERFAIENKSFNPYAFIPFSAGPRNCIGQRFAMLEMKTVLASILRRYHIRSLILRDQVIVSHSIMTKMESSLPVEFIKRH